jgi:hypothetical protein
MKVQINTKKCIIQPKSIYNTNLNNLSLTVLITKIGHKIANCIVLDCIQQDLIGDILQIEYKNFNFNLFQGTITLQNERT